MSTSVPFHAAMPFMLMSARSFADAGVSEYNKLVSVYSANVDAGKMPEFGDLIRHAMPAAVNLAFSIELWLKLIVWQRTGALPRGHDLQKLSAGLPDDVFRALAENFASEYLRQTGEVANVSGLRVGQFTFSGFAPAPAVVKPAATTLDLAFEELRDAFIVWRYLFEQVPLSSTVTVDLKALVLLPELLNNVFLSYADGNVTFNVG